MQFLVTAFDGTDAQALNRRLAARAAHIELGNKYMEEGKHLYAAAILNESEAMIGSVMIVEFSDREGLDSWLKEEPYVVGKVWEKIDIKPCKVGPSFAKTAI
jgi:uncharacterized protein YciI